MSKSTYFKVGGFIGTMAAGVAMVGAAVTGTGAYFTSSKDGELKAGAGHLTLNTTDTALSFTDLMPGEDKTMDVGLNVDVTGKSDIWLVFDTTTKAYGQFSGTKGGSAYPDGGLGRFGHFRVSVNGGPALFESWNLQLAPAGEQNCTDADGHGIGTKPINRDETPGYCGVPAYMKLATNLSSGEARTVNLTFGLTGRAANNYQFGPVTDVPFKLVATQAGVRPDASNF